MAKARNQYEVLAREAAERVELARAQGQQLTFLADEAGAPPVDTIDRKAGRPKGATNKGTSQLRDYLAAKGLRLPEQVLAEMAGLATSDDAVTHAIAQAERVLTWAYAGALDDDGNPVEASPGARLSVFGSIYTAALRAADALMPYGTAKASPDTVVNQAVQIVMPAPAQAPVVEARAIRTGRMVPADVAAGLEQNQRVSESGPSNSDDAIRTGEVSD